MVAWQAYAHNLFCIYSSFITKFAKTDNHMNFEWDSKPGTLWQTQEDGDIDVLTESLHNLIVWNDEVNTFEWVIDTLMEICGHSHEQAEQCAYIIHFQGKYAVKNGSYDELKPKCDAITDRGIGATVEMVVQ